MNFNFTSHFFIKFIFEWIKWAQGKVFSFFIILEASEMTRCWKKFDIAVAWKVFYLNYWSQCGSPKDVNEA